MSVIVYLFVKNSVGFISKRFVKLFVKCEVSLNSQRSEISETGVFF